MKQLYSAGPLHASGDSQPRARPEPAFRAASAGLRSEDVQATLSYTGYAPPPARNGDRGPLPVRLALLQTPAAGRVLAHVAPNGGTYFAHALLNVPATADAQLAIQTWGSPLWQRHEPETPGELPELPYLPVADVLDDAALRTWLGEANHREMLEFVLHALAVTPAGTHVYLAAPADDVARVVYAVTRAVPCGLLDDFTFSTYEPDPLSSPARLVGCDTGAADWELPAGCYEGTGVAYNLATGRSSGLPGEVPFAAFAVQALASGETGPLDEFRATWQRLGLGDPRHFDLVFRLAHAGTAPPTKDEAAAAAQHPTLAALIAARPDVVRQLVQWAIEDADFARQTLGRVIVPLRQRPDWVAKLAAAVQKAGFAALTAGDRVRTENALEVILPLAAPGRANAVWGEVLSQVADPDALTWELRWYLLPRLVRFKHQNAPAAAADAALARWIGVPAERLGELLPLELPRPYHLAAARACLNRISEPTETFAKAVAAQPALVLALLQPHDGVSDDRAVKLFELLLSESPSHPWFDDVLAHGATFPAERRNRFLEAALAAGAVDADRVVRTQGDRLFELFAGQSGLDPLGRLFLATPPADVFTDVTLLGFLARLADEPQVGDDVKGRAAAVRAVRAFLDAPAVDRESLVPVAAALTTDPPVLPPAAREQVLDAVHAELCERSDAPEFQRDLEAVLLHLGPAVAEDPAALYRELLRRQRARRDFARHAGCVHALLAVALGAVRDESLATHADGLEGEAFTVAAEAARRGGRRLVRDLDARSKDWPKAARTQWGFLSEAVRPKGLGQSARDLALFAAGAGGASAAWFVVAQLVR